MKVTEDLKMDLLKAVISTADGWRTLAASVMGSTNPNAKQECIELLRKIGSDKKVMVSGDDIFISAIVSDLLIEQLEENIKLYHAKFNTDEEDS